MSSEKPQPEPHKDSQGNTEIPLDEQRQRLEAERMTRREALRKIGITAGLGAFGFAFSEQFARATLNQLYLHQGNQVVADVVAGQFSGFTSAVETQLVTGSSVSLFSNFSSGSPGYSSGSPTSSSGSPGSGSGSPTSSISSASSSLSPSSSDSSSSSSSDSSSSSSSDDTCPLN